MKQYFVCLLALSLVCAEANGQKKPDQKHLESIQKKVWKCVDNQQSVVIWTYDDRRLQGTIREAGPDSFVLSHGQQMSTFAYSDVKNIKWHSEVSRQAKALIGATIVTGILFGIVFAVALARD